MYPRNYICLKSQQKNSRYRPLQYMFFKLLQSGPLEDPPKHNQAILWVSAKHNSCYVKKIRMVINGADSDTDNEADFGDEEDVAEAHWDGGKNVSKKVL